MDRISETRGTLNEVAIDESSGVRQAPCLFEGRFRNHSSESLFADVSISAMLRQISRFLKS